MSSTRKMFKILVKEMLDTEEEKYKYSTPYPKSNNENKDLEYVWEKNSQRNSEINIHESYHPDGNYFHSINNEPNLLAQTANTSQGILFMNDSFGSDPNLQLTQKVKTTNGK